MRQKDQPQPGGRHPEGQRIGQRAAIGVEADKGLQDGRHTLENQRNQADLGKGEREVVFQDRIDRRDQRLHQIVHEVPHRDCHNDRQHCRLDRRFLG